MFYLIRLIKLFGDDFSTFLVFGQRSVLNALRDKSTKIFLNDFFCSFSNHVLFDSISSDVLSAKLSYYVCYLSQVLLSSASALWLPSFDKILSKKCIPFFHMPAI